MVRPNFFIVGAPRCGTTALSEYLRGHPRTFLCRPKEPHFFATDFPSHRYVATEEDYLKLFQEAGPECLAAGEASSWYLYSREAIPNIRRFDPEARIIAMLRNPVDLVTSLHGLFLRDFAEDESDLRRAWELQEKRRDGQQLPKGRNTRYDPSTLLYGDACRLGAQVERLLGVFPREQVELVLFDDLTGETRATYERVLAFLGLPSDGREEFHVANPRRDYKSRRLGRLAFELWSLGSRVKNRLGIVSTFGVWRHIEPYLMKRTEAAAPDPEFRARLVEEFRPDVEHLAAILQRDLSHWLR